MTVQDLCQQLVQLRNDEILAVTEGLNKIPEDVFAEALTPDWLAANIQKIFEVLNTKPSRENALVGSLESNAFLAAFQKAYENQNRTRAQRWAGVYSQVGRTSAEGGALAVQLNHIGVKVDEEFIERVVMQETTV